MKKYVVVSLADSNYFPLLDELINSIKRFNESNEIAICILDAGLTEKQKESLSTKVDEIKAAEWDIEVPDSKIKGKEWLKSQVSRAFLPKYFPDYEKYLWIDCDAWVNTWETVELYFKACENGKVGITQTIGPGYKITSKVNWVFGKLAIIKSQNFKHAVKSKIGFEKARKLAFAPHINIGVFSLEKNSPGWISWQKNLEITLKAGNIFGSEGLAINMSVYIDDLETEFLPLNCNWIASNLLPKFDEENSTFVEPYLPNYKIGIMHLAAGIWKDKKDMRLNKEIKIDIKTLNGKTLKKTLRFNNILGDIYLDTIPGIIHFEINGEDYSFEPTISASGNFFVAYEDLTSGNETYGGGRYLYILPEDKNNNVIIDFNKSLNPPCVFSTFTTCPVPRKENKLSVKINAGEKNQN